VTKGIPETFIDLNFDPQIRPRTQIKGRRCVTRMRFLRRWLRPDAARAAIAAPPG
jgi:hypothetical protein